MKHAVILGRSICIWMICLMISFFFVSYANAQERVVTVIPLWSDKDTLPAPVEKTGQSTQAMQRETMVICKRVLPGQTPVLRII